jgi:YVTN family beta-propeller protein
VRVIGSGPEGSRPIRAVVVGLLIACSGLGIVVGTPSTHSIPPLLARELSEMLVDHGLPASRPVPTPGARVPGSTPTPGFDPGTLRRPASLVNPVVNHTLVLENNTLVPGNYLGPSAEGPQDAAYDPAKGEVFVSSYGGTVAVINATTNRVTAVVTVQVGAEGLAYDGGKGEVFVADSTTQNVSVINDTNNTVVATIPIAPAAGTTGTPTGVVYDSAKGEIFVTDPDSNLSTNSPDSRVSVINDTNDAVVAAIPVNGTYPEGIACNPGVDEIYVQGAPTSDLEGGMLLVISDRENAVLLTVTHGADFASGIAYASEENEIFLSNSMVSNVSVFSASTFQWEAGISVGNYADYWPGALTEDPDLGLVFVSEDRGTTVSAIDELTNTVGATVAVGFNPQGMTFDPSQGELFVANTGGNVSVISDGSAGGGIRSVDSIGLFWTPDAIAYDSGKGELFVTELGDAAVSVISDATNTMVATIPVDPYPGGIAYDSGKGELFVADSGSSPNYYGNVSIISDATNSVVDTIPLRDPIGVAYDDASGLVFVTDGGFAPYFYGNLSVISDVTDSVVTTVPLGSYPTGVVYDSGTEQVFVLNNNDRVTIISALNDTLVRNVPESSTPTSVLYDGMSGEIYVGTYGNVSVISDANDTVVANISLGLGPKDLTYDSGDREVYVSNQGLNDVSVIDTATHSVVATVAVGANPGGLAYDRARATTYVPNEYQSTVSMIYQATPAPTYPVTFAETGLPSGTSWSVTLAGSFLTSTAGVLSTSEPNGSYAYSVAPVSGFDSTPASGSVAVLGRSVTLNITFTARLGPGQYLVTFEESGLPTATSWGVTLNGTLMQSSSGAIHFTEGNGSLSFEVESVDGYTANPGTGSVNVNGTALSLSIVFQTTLTPLPNHGTGPAKVWGLPPVEAYELVIGIALAALLAGVGGFFLRRRTKAPPPPGTGSTPAADASRSPPPP